MKMRLTIPVLLALLVAMPPAPGMAAGAAHPTLSHCLANSYALPYPSAGLGPRAPRLIGYAIPYPPADLDGDSHNCLANSATRSEDGNDGGSFVRNATPFPPASLDLDAPLLGGYAIPYPPVDLDGDNSPPTVHYGIPYPSADWGDGDAYLVR